MTAPYPERVKALAKAAAKRNKPYDPVPKECPISGDSVIACVYYKAGKAGMHYYVCAKKKNPHCKWFETPAQPGPTADESRAIEAARMQDESEVEVEVKRQKLEAVIGKIEKWQSALCTAQRIYGEKTASLEGVKVEIANAEGRISTQRGGRGKQDAETLREREVRLVKEIEKKAASIRDLQDKFATARTEERSLKDELGPVGFDRTPTASQETTSSADRQRVEAVLGSDRFARAQLSASLSASSSSVSVVSRSNGRGLAEDAPKTPAEEEFQVLAAIEASRAEGPGALTSSAGPSQQRANGGRATVRRSSMVTQGARASRETCAAGGREPGTTAGTDGTTALTVLRDAQETLDLLAARGNAMLAPHEIKENSREELKRMAFLRVTGVPIAGDVRDSQSPEPAGGQGSNKGKAKDTGKRTRSPGIAGNSRSVRQKVSNEEVIDLVSDDEGSDDIDADNRVLAYIVWYGSPSTWDAANPLLPKIFKLRITLPTALWRLPKLSERMGLEMNTLLEHYDTKKSNWDSMTRFTPLVANIMNNNIWVIKKRHVGYCEDVERFALIARHATVMPALEAGMAEYVEEVQITLAT